MNALKVFIKQKQSVRVTISVNFDAYRVFLVACPINKSFFSGPFPEYPFHMLLPPTPDGSKGSSQVRILTVAFASLIATCLLMFLLLKYTFLTQGNNNKQLGPCTLTARSDELADYRVESLSTSLNDRDI